MSLKLCPQRGVKNENICWTTVHDVRDMVKIMNIYVNSRNSHHTIRDFIINWLKKKHIKSQVYCVQILFINNSYILQDIFNELNRVNDQLMFVFITESILVTITWYILEFCNFFIDNFVDAHAAKLSQLLLLNR